MVATQPRCAFAVNLFSRIELTAAHKKLALRIGANKAAPVIDQFGAADGTELPPVFGLGLWWLD
jgi:hypothetical protein